VRAGTDDGSVIHNAVLHLNNEQPMVADLFDLPSSLDQGLRCTNLRTLDGKRPVFIDDVRNVFFFPYLHIRFVEIPHKALASDGETALPVPTNVRAGLPGGPDDGADEDLEIDEDFLRRIREA
jgi:hypothetical protein